MYTLKNQQLYWNQSYYILNKGVPTGGKHCVPLANILLSYIIKSLLRSNLVFKNQFSNSLKLWKRFIDDCGGIFIGIKDFDSFFKTLEDKFEEFGLRLTHEVSKEKLILLDVEVYIEDGMFHTKEHRKETASHSYIKFGSAHPTHSFKGIIKSQMYRLRRLCSKESDFISATNDLRNRCINSGYDEKLVDGILGQASTLERSLVSKNQIMNNSDIKIIRWVILSGTSYEKNISDFARNINDLMKNQKIKLELVKSTGSSIGRLLFNNREKYEKDNKCSFAKCTICKDEIRSEEYEVKSKITSYKYHIDTNTNCDDGAIYRITCPCSSAYTGKTTSSFGRRFAEHF